MSTEMDCDSNYCLSAVLAIATCMISIPILAEKCAGVDHRSCNMNDIDIGQSGLVNGFDVVVAISVAVREGGLQVDVEKMVSQ